jgi:hypothetical protein
MGNTTIISLLLVCALVGIGTSGCSKTASTDLSSINSAVSLPNHGNFRLSLTDAPHPSLSHVFVNVDHVELLLEKNGDAGRLVVGQNLGTIDLLKLRDGVHLPIKDLNLKDSVVVKQFRLILKDTGNSIVRKSDGSVCELKTPSQQQTGLKLIMPNGGIEIEQGQIYSLIVDFDVDHSIVDNKNNCLLKPVLKVKTLLKVPEDSDESGDDNTTPSADDGTSTSGDTTPGADDGASTGGDTTPGADDGTSTGGDTAPGTDGTTTGGDTPPTDSTGTASGDGAPIISEGNSTFFN